MGIGLWIGTLRTGSSQVLLVLLLSSKFFEPRIFRTASLASSSLLINFGIGLVYDKNLIRILITHKYWTHHAEAFTKVCKNPHMP